MPSLSEIIDFVLPHNPEGQGVRPMDDESLRQIRETIRGGGVPSDIAQRAVRAGNRVTISQGPRGLMGLIRNTLTNLATPSGFATAGTFNPAAQHIQINPEAAARIGADIPTNILPHELVHNLRTATGLDKGDAPTEEAIARLAVGRPANEIIPRFAPDFNRLAELRGEARRTLRLADLLEQKGR